ncbi:TPA: helix-turn-helix transcriptional regulator [Streptococcus equi subsp. zooepidemicus]|uniref:Helix-turn-helix transcriptional regulator n=4 Tax=Streptococcus equi TaxID=1336 RepID=A0A6M1KZQ7_9STRE|nr:MULTISPECIES: helix-turn-helix transcriptional regulator [Streptococcus]MCD3392045.1 helix-turn-helix domain-containing protein [Streptococcus equi subsp. zooepidemicus]MCD3392047.1 helix-turn-helix domain-containing protein [Streptococcus equi subsp. zooepidemicus]MCD3392052.1 helix-turn-helix domain-containing protein [Streptococcus equi subsp. zooepidemicus]MCD3406338.1 helix-turn-helix domain-containing protein [Streptococcus equi subsp. zooepidemicus]MCD3406343.1 helix-turn-helix domai
MSLQENLRVLRKQKQLSQSDLANELMVTRQAVSSWENGKSLPDVYTLSRIAELFGVSLDDLMVEDNKQTMNINKDGPKNKLNLLREYSKYVIVLVIVFTLACTLPKDISVPIMFFGKLILIFFILLLVIYFLIKRFLE